MFLLACCSLAQWQWISFSSPPPVGNLRTNVRLGTRSQIIPQMILCPARLRKILNRSVAPEFSTRVCLISVVRCFRFSFQIWRGGPSHFFKQGNGVPNRNGEVRSRVLRKNCERDANHSA